MIVTTASPSHRSGDRVRLCKVKAGRAALASENVEEVGEHECHDE